jgi:hypothetical protein
MKKSILTILACLSLISCKDVGLVDNIAEGKLYIQEAKNVNVLIIYGGLLAVKIIL